jgi:DNA repair exonuclease SbcCD nuclease subunit
MLAIITDTHVGARSSSSIFRDYMKFWYDTVFFPKLMEQDCKTILHLGDFFDNRTTISVQDIDFVVNWFAKRLVDDGIQFYVTLGNHDVAFKNTNRIHSLSILKAAAPNNVTVIEEANEYLFDGNRYLLVPWINAENYQDTMSKISNTPDKGDVIVAGHFELSGFLHYKNSIPATHGLDASLFKDFKELWSGHFHHKSKIGNARYMGSAFHLNWQDYNDDRGFHFYDGTLLEFVPNEHCLFTHVTFEEDVFSKMSDKEYSDLFEGMFVRLTVTGDYSKVALMDTITKINRSKPHDLQVINDSLVNGESETEEQVESKTAKSTADYITSYIEERQDLNTTEIKTLVQDLYESAMKNMAKGE